MNGEKVKELSEKLEVFYLANKSENIYFTILGDPKKSIKEIEEKDEEIKTRGIYEIEKLNKKYKKEGMPRFNFIYRKRLWNKREQCYLGWERKRGLLTELNDYLISKNSKPNTFLVNTIEDFRIKKHVEVLNIKYIITLDNDTNLTLNSGIELIEAMAHPLNRPRIDEEKNVVIDGHGIMQPRIGIDLETSYKSDFTEIFAGDGGVDSYTNAISDIYQDNFEEGIYTGKGIYDLEVFTKVMKEKIAENTVLSHDLLEGSILRCGLCSDIMLLDGYPSTFDAYMTRLERWVRGDWQIVSYLKEKYLNKLSKFKILDNIRRSLVPIFDIFNLILLIILKINLDITIWPYMFITLLSIVISSVLDILNYIIFRKENIRVQKNFTRRIDGLFASVCRGIIEMSILPYKAWVLLKAIIKTIYRMSISKEHLLEWTTAEEAEKKNETKLSSMYKKMKLNVILGIITFLLSIVYNLPKTALFFSALWIIAPIIMWYISKTKEETKPKGKLQQDEIKYIKGIAENTWNYFADFMNKDENYLPPDNFQESRREKIVHRTSSTNIGLGLMTIISAYDLKFITLEKAITFLVNIMDTISKLDKWYGHLYNWYDTKTLKPLIPKYVSTVDSGNFIRIYVHIKRFFKGKGIYSIWWKDKETNRYYK